MKKRYLTVLIGLILFSALFVSCESMLEIVVKPKSGTSKEAVEPKGGSGDPLEGYVFINDGGHYHLAKVLKPASDQSKGQAEVLDMYSNEKIWAEVIEHHAARESELTVGTAVLHQGSGFEDPDKDTLIATSWTAYYITDTSDLFKGRVNAGGIDVPVKHLRVPEGEIDM